MKEKPVHEHQAVTETEFAKVCEFRCEINSIDLLFDLKNLMKEYFVATFTTEGDALSVKFNNGQRFVISVTQC